MVQTKDLQRFAGLFAGFTSRFGTFEIPDGQPDGKKKGTARTVAGPIHESHYLAHLKGETGIGLIPLLNDDCSARFGCIDIDKYPMDFDALERDSSNLPVVITKSKSGGAHVWLFTIEPVPAKLIQDSLKAWAAALGFGKAEIFPKQIKRLSPTDAGNWINLPYFGSTRRAWFGGRERSLFDFLEYAEGRRMNAATLEHLLKELDNQPIFADGPPCLATLAKKGIGPGARNMVLLNVGSYFKKRDPANFLVNLLEFNKKYLTEPLPESEINASIAKSLQRKSYPYQCNQEPMCSACNRAVCLKREFGVGGGVDELEIALTGLTKVATDPPIWYVNIDGVRVELNAIDALINQGQLRVIAAESVHKLFPLIKKRAWDQIVNDLLHHVEVVEAPPDSSLQGQFAEEIREFIAQYGQDDSMDQVATRSVFKHTKTGRAYFLSADLLRRIKKNIGPHATVQKLWAFLRSNGQYDVQAGEFLVGGCEMRLWHINYTHLGLPSTPLDPPKAAKASNETIPF